MSLFSLVREIIAEFPTAHPHKLARLVVERTPEGNLEEYYLTALERVVGDVLRSSRNATMNSKQSRSAKTEQRRGWWAQMLTERVHVGESKWKPLGQCSADDLQFCISERQEQIGKLSGQIAKYEAILDAVLEHDAVVVADLPEGAVQL